MRSGHPLVGRCLVGIDRGVFRRVLHDEVLQRGTVGAGNHLGPDLLRLAVLRTDHGFLAHRAASGPRQLFALGVGHVLPLAVDVRLIDLDGTDKVAAVNRQRVTDAVGHEPCALLRDAKIAMQLHGRYALQGSGAKVDADGPLAKGNLSTAPLRSLCAR